jgi:hypothetical protein
LIKQYRRRGLEVTIVTILMIMKPTCLEIYCTNAFNKNDSLVFYTGAKPGL